MATAAQSRALLGSAAPYRWAARSQRVTLRPIQCAPRVLDRSPGRRSVQQEDPEAEEDAPSAPFIQQLVKLETIHAIPSFIRPWDAAEEVQTISSGFILDVDRRWIMTTAGAVDYPRRVGDQLAGLCPPLDIAAAAGSSTCAPRRCMAAAAAAAAAARMPAALHPGGSRPVRPQGLRVPSSA